MVNCDAMRSHWRSIFCILVSFVASLSAASDDQYDERFALGVFGNANLDDRIDESDIAYTQEVIAGRMPIMMARSMKMT